MKAHSSLLPLALLALWIGPAGRVVAQTPTSTGFTYQGRLTVDGAIPDPGEHYDLLFRLFDAASGGNRGEPAVVASHSERSALVRFVRGEVEDLEMPPLGKRDRFAALTQAEVARLRAWIDQGAVWPDGVVLQVAGNEVRGTTHR